jgi:F-type H+-transporting ATPase subunit epsilon
MADTLQFDLVSPERRLASLRAREVQIPGVDGDLTAMPGHAPMITTLRPGIVRVAGPDGEAAYVVTGGFAEITAEATSVLAERAIPVAEAKGDVLDAMIAEAQAAADAAPADGKDKAQKMLADMLALRVAVNV